MMNSKEVNSKYPAPVDLQPDSAKVWRESIVVIENLYGDVTADLELLRAYCIVTALFRKSSAAVDKEPVILDKNGRPFENPLIPAMKSYGLQMRQYAEALGMTVKERKRIQRQEKKEIGKRSGPAYEKFKNRTQVK